MSRSSTVVVCVLKSHSRTSRSSSSSAIRGLAAPGAGCGAAGPGGAAHAVQQGAHHVEVEGVAELEGARLVGSRERDASLHRIVAPRPALAERAVDRRQGRRADAADRARRELAPVGAAAQEARLAEAALEVADQDQRALRPLREQLPQRLGREGFEVPLRQVAGQAFEGLHALAEPLGLVVVGRLGAPEALAALLAELLEGAQALQLLEQRPEVRAGVLVLELVVAHALERVREAPVLGVAARQERVQPCRLEAVGGAQRPLLAVQDLVEAPPEILARAVQVVALLERADLALELVHHLLQAHHPHVEAAQLEAVLAHPLERLVDVQPFHQELRQRVEGALRVEGELLLGAVPAAVAVELHPRA